RTTGLGAPSPGLTTADVLEAIHRATGLNLLGDYFIRFHLLDSPLPDETSLAEALSSLSQAMQLRWLAEDGFLLFRSAGFCHDRLSEIPHRTLSRWAESRRQNGRLSFEDLIEIASLS